MIIMDAFNNWREEKRSSYLYQILALKEKKATNKTLFKELGQMAEAQAKIWEKSILESGGPTPESYKPDIRTRVVGYLISLFGARPIRSILAAMKVRGLAVYLNNKSGHPFPKTLEDIGIHHHTNNSNNLRAAVFGMNDGLISNACLIFGIVGAHLNPKTILITGIAGLLAGACSMASGEYISIRSQREMFEYQIALEKEELELYPEEEAAELALIYEARGFPKAEAEHISKTIIQNPEQALDVLAREELGLNPNDLGCPWGAAISSFISFAVGAFIPLLPLILHARNHLLSSTMTVTALALFSIGTIISLFVGKSAIRGGLRMLAIGAAACITTYFIGHGVSQIDLG